MDDDLPLKGGNKTKNLDPLSVDELEDYICELNLEIERVKQEIEKKKAFKNAAEGFFKT